MKFLYSYVYNWLLIIITCYISSVICELVAAQRIQLQVTQQRKIGSYIQILLQDLDPLV